MRLFALLHVNDGSFPERRDDHVLREAAFITGEFYTVFVLFDFGVKNASFFTPFRNNTGLV